jgi:hypothetical protein
VIRRSSLARARNSVLAELEIDKNHPKGEAA